MAAYAYSVDIWLPLLAATILAALGIYTWRRREMHGARPLAIAWLCSATWMLATAVEAAAINPATISAWHMFGAMWRLPAATATACFALEYAQPGRWLTRRVVALLTALPLLVALLVLSNDSHQLLWRLTVEHDPTIPHMEVGSVIAVIYIVVLAVVQVSALTWLFVRSPQHRWPVALMLLTLLITRTVLLAVFIFPISNAEPDIDVVVALFTAGMYAIALFGFRMLDPLPAARQTLVEQMHAGVVVFDAQLRVTSLNPAAERILGVYNREARGRTWHELARPGAALPDLPSATPQQRYEESDELTIGYMGQARQYAPLLSELQDFRGLAVGYVLVLRDVTEHLQTRTRILEQERALAMLREREQLARELHDGVAQMLAAAHFQAVTAKLLATNGQRSQLEACLDSLADTTLQAEGDVREYLMGVKSSRSNQRALFPALRDYLARYEKQYNLPVALSVAPELEAKSVSPALGLQVLRIVQEALTNVRKHAPQPAAGAAPLCHVQIIFASAGDEVRIEIIDGGNGFDLAASDKEGHYGLRAMEERAAVIGGRLAVISSPGQGTQVSLVVPWGNGPTAPNAQEG
ncbi:MAG: PAS domain-containing protein [Anaerolineales bacterium]|nr:PAS domain-containing protein [Anaerolineales bacterium]